MMTMRAFLDRESLHGWAIARLNDHQVVDRIAQGMVSGRYKLIAAEKTPLIGGGSTTAPDRTPIAPESSSVPAPRRPAAGRQTTRWVEFLVVDHDTWKPVEGVILKIRIPSEGTRTLSTDANGQVRIVGLDAATCDINEIIDLEALEVVKVDSSPD